MQRGHGEEKCVLVSFWHTDELKEIVWFFFLPNHRMFNFWNFRAAKCANREILCS